MTMKKLKFKIAGNHGKSTFQDHSKVEGYLWEWEGFRFGVRKTLTSWEITELTSKKLLPSGQVFLTRKTALEYWGKELNRYGVEKFRLLLAQNQ